MKRFVIASALVLMPTVCHARVGETQAQVEARYGKHVEEIVGAQDGNRHWISADGKLTAVYNAKHYQLLIESSDFSRQRQAAVSNTK